MATRLTGRLSLLLLAFAAVMLILPAMALATTLSADDTTSTSLPTIQSDQADYPPGATVTLTGSNWQPGESVHIKVNDDQGQTWSRDADVTADASGQIQDQFQLPDWFVATYSVRATGASGAVATTSFLDSNVNVGANLSTSESTQVQWQRYNSTDCTGTALTGSNNTGTLTLTGSATSPITGGAESGSIKLTATAQTTTSPKKEFNNWVPSGSATSANISAVSGSGNNVICTSGFNSGNNTHIYKANYGNTAPSTPGTPSASSNPNRGAFTLSWTASVDAEGNPITYRLEHKSASDTSYSLVTGADSLSTNSFSFTSAAQEDEGTWTYRVQASDSSTVGNLGSAFSTDSAAIKVDKTAPETTIDSKPADPTNSTSARFDFSSNETGSTFQCSLDNGSFSNCTSPKSYSSLTNGSHTFQVRATDAAGNVEATPASYTWTIDRTAPLAPVISSPVNNSTVGASFTLSGTAEANSTVELFEGTTSKGTTQAGANGNWSKALSGVSEGSHTYTAKATDAAGNTSAASSSRTVIVDATAPATTITAGPASGSTVNSASVSFSFSSNETGSTFQCSLDGAAYTACTSPQNYTNLSDGSHTFSVKATDAVGNTGSPASRTWTVSTDSTAPTSTASAKNADNSTYNSGDWTKQNVTVSLNASDNQGGTGVDSITYSATGAQTIAQATQQGNSVTLPAITAEGTTTVTYKATDKAGNVETAKTFTVKIDKSAPVISGADFVNSGWTNQDVSKPFTATDSLSGLAEADKSFDITASAESTKDAQGNVVPTKASRTVTDLAGNESLPRSVAAQIDKTAPVIGGQDTNNTTWRNTDLSVPYTATDNLSGLAPADQSFDITASAESTKDAQGNVIPTKVEKTVKDLAGNVSNTRSVSAQIDKTAPVVDGPDFVNSGWTNQDVSKTFAANDALSGLAESQKSLTLTASAESTKDAQGNVIPTEVSGKVTDLAGNESLPRKLSAKIDRTNPVISGADINDTTWRNTDRSAGFTASDGLSGLSVATDSSFTLTASAESTKDSSGNVVPTQVSKTVTDQAGNSAKRSLSAKIDKTSPSVSASVSPNAAPSGWYNKATGAPTVRYQCSDALSGLPGTCPADHIFGEGANQSHSSGDVYDQAGNKASASVDNIDVDLTAPTKPQAGFGRAPEDSTGGYFKDAVTVSYSGSTDSGGSDLKSISSSQIFNTTGAHNYSGVAEDNAGNVSDAASGTVKVDASVPDVQPGDVVDSTWRNGSLSKSFKATDTGSGLNASGLAADGSLTFNLEASAESQAPDKPTIVQRTISDKVGHSVTRSVSALIDLTRPNISASTTKDPAPSGWYNLDTGAPVVHFECSDLLSGIAALSCPADHTITTEGTNQGYSDSVPDRAGNTNSAGVSGLKIDLTRPAAAGAPDLLASSDSGDPNDNQTNVRTPTFDVNAETGSTVKLYGQKDGAATAALLGSGPATNGLATITSAQALSDGTYTFHATVTDQAGNVSSTQDIKVTIVTIDASAPTFSNVPSDQIVEATSAQGAPVTYTKPSADDSVDGPVAVDCQPASGTVFALGATTVNCSATDKAGNKASASFKVTVQDTNAPKNEALSGPSGWIKENSASFNWSFSDIVTNTADLQYSYRLDGTEVDWSPYSSTTSKSLSGLSEGSHTFFVRAKDAAGNVAIAQQSFGVDTIAPAITPGDDLSDGTWYSSAQQRSFAATDGGSGLDARAGLSANGGFTLSVSTEPTTKDANGNYVPVVDSYTVFDKAGNSTTRRFSALIDLGNPLLGITDNNVASYNVCQGAPSKPGFNPSDALSGLDLAKTKDSWTSNLQPSGVGSYTYSAQAYDLAGRSATYGPKTYNVVYGAAFGGVLQPINADGSSRFKLGSTVPVKFKLMCGSTPIDNAVAKLNVKKFDSTPDAGVDEVISTAASTTGNLFRYDAMSGQYIFNLSTKSGYTQTVNGVTQTVSFAQGTYTLSIILDDGTYRNVNIQIVR